MMLLNDGSHFTSAASATSRSAAAGIAVACVVAVAAFVTSLVALNNSSSSSGGRTRDAINVPPPTALVPASYAGKHILMIAAHPDDAVGANGGLVFDLVKDLPLLRASMMMELERFFVIA